MLLKINLTIITIIQLTLLISFISADNNKNDLNYLRKQFSNDLSDTNSDLKWWEYLTSDNKEKQNLIGSESVAFDVVQTHLSEDEDNEEIQTTTTTRAPIVSPRIVNSGKSNTNFREPTKTRPTATLRPTTESSRIAEEDNEIKSVKGGVKTSKQIPKKISQPTIATSRPIVKSVTPKLVTTTSSSLDESDEDEEIENNIIKKPAPVITQPKKQQKPATKTIPSRPQISGTKTKQVPTKTTSAPVPKVAPRKVITTTSKPSIDEEDDEEEKVIVTTRRPIVVPQPKKIPAVTQPATKTIPSRPQISGTKTKQVPQAKTTQTRKQPAIVTTSRPLVTDSEDDEEEEKVVVTTRKPTIVVQPAVKRPTPQQPKPLPPRIGNKQPTKTPGTKTRPSVVVQPKVTRPAVTVTTTQRPTTLATTTESDDSEDEPLPTVRTIPVQPKKVSQPTKTPSGVKTRQPAPRPTSRPAVVIQTTTSKPLIDEDDENEDENLPAAKPQPTVAPRKTIQTTTSRPTTPRKVSVSGTKTKPLPPRIGNKQPTKTPGTKTRPSVVVQPKVTRPAVTVTTTQRPTTLATTTESDDSEDEPLPTVRTIPVQPKKVPSVSQPTKTPSGVKTRQPAPRPTSRPAVVIQTTTSKPLIDEDDEEEEKTAPRTTLRPAIISTTTTRKPAPRPTSRPAVVIQTTTSKPLIDEDDDNEENNAVPISPVRKMIESRKPSRQNGGVKRPTSQPGTKTRQTPAKISPRPVITTPARKQPEIVTTSRPSSITEDDEEEEEKVVTTRKPTVIVQPAVKRPAPQQPVKTTSTKTKQVDTGVKTRQPASRPTSRPVVVVQTTTSKPLIDEDDSEEDENLPAAKPQPTVAPRPAVRPTIQTTTTKTITENEVDEEEVSEKAPKRDIPKPLPRRPSGTKTRPAPTGTKTISTGTKTRPAPRVIATTARPLVTTSVSSEESDEDELPVTKSVSQPRAPSPRPQIITTTRKPIVVINENDEEEEINEIPERKPVPSPMPRGVKRPPGSPPVKTPAIGTKTPSRPSGVKTIQPAPRITTSRPVITTEDDSEEDENLPAAKPQPTIAPRPQRPTVVQPTTKRPVVEVTSDDELPAVEKRRPAPVPKPLPRPVGTKTPTKTAPRKVAITTVSPVTQPASSNDESDEDEATELPVRKAVPSPLPRKVSPKIIKPITEEDDEDNELPVSKRPVVPPPQPRKIGGTKGGSRAGTKVISTPTLKPRVTVTTTASSLKEESDSESDNDQDEKVDVIPAKPEIPKPLGRKVVNRPRVDNQQPTIVTTPSAVNNRRISTSNMPVPRPVSFNRRSKTSPAKEQPVAETTTLEPIPVPVFESTRRPANPIIQSITSDNEEESENSNQQLPRKKSAVRNVIISSDLAKFSSRVRYAERQPLNNNNQNKYSSYSPPLIDSLVEPNNESFIEINRIK